MYKKGILAVVVVLLGILLAFAVFSSQQPEEIENAGSSEHADRKPIFLTYDGREYPIKKHVQTVLVIGTDSEEQYQEVTHGLKPIYSYAQADFLLLLVLDNDAEKVEVIQINRDTMMDVPWLDVVGHYGGTKFMQICLAYNYGDGGIKSCRNTCNAVSSLLFDAPIDNYIQLPLSAIPVVNDLVGGVPVTIEEDLTELDPAFVAGATVKLQGAQAEKFVRARMGLQNDTNLYRMHRQRIYMDSFQQCAKKAIDTDSSFVMRAVKKMSEHLQSDLTAEQLANLVEKLGAYDIRPISPPQGELVSGEEYYEFYVDMPALWETVKNAYCT